MASTTFAPQPRSAAASGVLIGAVLGVLGLLAAAVLVFGVLGYQRWTQQSSPVNASAER